MRTSATSWRSQPRRAPPVTIPAAQAASSNAAIGAIQRADEHGDDGEITEALAQLSKAKTAIAAAEGALRDEKRAGA